MEPIVSFVFAPESCYHPQIPRYLQSTFSLAPDRSLPLSQCSHQCGPGTASRTVLCVSFSSGQYGVVSDRACSSRRPRAEQSCGDGDCPAGWFSTEWSPCSVSCGPGSQSRTVACVDSAGRRAAGCSAAEAPPERRACLLAECPKIGRWQH